MDGAAAIERGGYPVEVRIGPALADRNRLTTAFRLVLAFPHLLLVGGPMAAAFLWGWGPRDERGEWAGGGGVLGAAAGVCALIAWFAIVFTGRHPRGLWRLAAFYLRWRVKAVSYTALLTDPYPPFGEGPYPADLRLDEPVGERNRLTVAFRIVLAIPHLVALFFLSLAWALTSVIAWFAILFTGRYPEGLYRFGVGVLAWNARVESYLLLLHDAYPPFALHAGSEDAAGAPEPPHPPALPAD